MSNTHFGDEVEKTQKEDLWTEVEQFAFLRNAPRKETGNGEKSAFSQFFTPYPIAKLMSSMFTYQASTIRILDAGAGSGLLFVTMVTELCQRSEHPHHITVTAYEIDDALIKHLENAMYHCERLCNDYHIKFTGTIKHEYFIKSGFELLSDTNSLFSLLYDKKPSLFDCAIINPPYKKIRNDWLERHLLKEIGIEAPNLYVGFLAIAMHLLTPLGELVAITPRSFCNGPYFKKFRKDFLETMALQHLHTFKSRNQAFKEDKVLQENIILHAIKTDKKPDQVTITTSIDRDDNLILTNNVEYDEVVQPNDPEVFIRILQDDHSSQVIKRMSQLHTSLEELKITISTGRVVDFRALDFLRTEPEINTVPLIYPMHLQKGAVNWPMPQSKKPNAIIVSAQTQSLLLPNEHYVLVKRFSSKEEKKRIVATLYEPQQFEYPSVGIENHLNYFHQNGKGLSPFIAKGLEVYLNTSVVDDYFRQFNGHTQVNATDLRNIQYPTWSQLEFLGQAAWDSHFSQSEIDKLIEKELFHMPDNKSEETQSILSTLIKQKIEEALSIIKSLGFLQTQQNERSALTLLALLNLKPSASWSEAESPLCGITPMMDFFREYYNKDYKPNTRETVRRQTVHQFIEAGLIEANPDRPVNSPKAVYRVEKEAIELLRTFGTTRWDQNLRTYLTSVETIQKRYAQEREMKRIPVKFPNGQTTTLSPGGQNILIKQIIEDFGSVYTPDGNVLYVGDADEKFSLFEKEILEELGVQIEEHGKMPAVIIHYIKEDWLVLVEAVTSHGPIDWKRKKELESLFKNSRAGLVLVTAFLNRVAMLQRFREIAWETEVWIADAPEHLIHFNGKRFLGPYQKEEQKNLKES